MVALVQEARDECSDDGTGMSRIFDALSRTAGEYEDILLPLREDTPDNQVAVDPADRAEIVVLRDVLPIEDAPPMEAPLPEPAPEILYAPPLSSGAESLKGDARSTVLTGIRTVDLRIPRSVPALPFDGVHDAAGEEYRMIRSRILHHPSRPKVFLVSSPCPGDGKTVTTLNIAGALALKGTTDVLVIDGDFAYSAFGNITGIPSSPGLGEVLSGEARLEDAIVRASQFPSLHLLAAGKSNANPAELLDSEAWTSLMERIRRHFGYVVFDSPPVEAVPYYGRLLAACDGMVLVVRPDHSGRQELSSALGSTPPQKLLGVVLNCQRPWLLNKKDYRSYNRYYGTRQE